MKKLVFVPLSVASLFLLGLASGAGGGSAKPAIVLAHGTWADGNSWHKVIPILPDDGYLVTVSTPATVSVFPGENYQAPRSWTERAYERVHQIRPWRYM